MINISNIINDIPHIIFKNYFELALENNQKYIEAICISSFNINLNEVESRMVNLKYIKDNEWIFFSNYDSLKAKNFSSHNQISALFFWDSINVQVRIKAKIFKTASQFSDDHYKSRTVNKNALAISSNQSQKIDSYDSVVKNYNDILMDSSKVKNRPSNWGGYSFNPYYFEFWEGHESRLNKRDVYEMKSNKWQHSILQP
jgi:pyridoxamine 5'-phosphate oxidase